MSIEEYYNEEYCENLRKESIEKYKRAFEAMLAYEKNCMAKYDYPDWMCKPSKPPKYGETMRDYSIRYGTTIKEMKDCEMQVEKALVNNI